MFIKTLKKLTALSCAALLLGAPVFAQTTGGLKMKEYMDVAPGLTFVLPEDDLTIETSVDGSANPFFLDGEILANIKYKNLTAIVTSFKMEITANHTDWLIAYSKALGIKVTDLKTAKNKQGVVIGLGKFILPKYPDQPLGVAVAFGGDRGYFIQGKTKSSAALVKSAVVNMKVPGTPWGTLEPTKTITVGSKSIKINETFTHTPVSEGPMKGVVVTNAGRMEASAIILTVKTELFSDHSENRRVFEGELKSGNLEYTVIRDEPTETVFNVKSQGGKEFTGFIATQGTSSVSLIVPSITTNVNAWMSGKYYYNAAIRAVRR